MVAVANDDGDDGDNDSDDDGGGDDYDDGGDDAESESVGSVRATGEEEPHEAAQ